MKVKIHTLFEKLLESTAAAPEAVVGFSLSASPRLGDFLDDLDPDLSLDWNNRDFRGLPELRDHVLAQAGLAGVLERDSVLITAGAAEANYLALMQLLEPGAEIVVEAPGWPQAEVIASAKGAVVRRVWREEAEGWVLPLDRLARAVTPATRMIFLTNPNNPTGQLMGAEELREVVRIADRVGAWLIVDEVYAGLEWDAPRAPSVAGLYARGHHDRVGVEGAGPAGSQDRLDDLRGCRRDHGRGDPAREFERDHEHPGRGHRRDRVAARPARPGAGAGPGRGRGEPRGDGRLGRGHAADLLDAAPRRADRPRPARRDRRRRGRAPAARRRPTGPSSCPEAPTACRGTSGWASGAGPRPAMRRVSAAWRICWTTGASCAARPAAMSPVPARRRSAPAPVS